VQPELPTGTVTFLFTDIEGSTRLLRELGDGYAEVLAEHRRGLREAWRRHHGVEVDTQGDAFFVAFARASDAVAAAADGKLALEEGPVRVRMGLHTGEPLRDDEGYVGVDVHRAARIAAAGHGGQVLLSQATADIAGVDVRDLGLHRLKDLSAPERLFQLGTGDFPPLKTLRETNLPVPATAFFGREREIDRIAGLLRRPDVRLVTLTGPGGSGKTRLSLQAAAAAADYYDRGVWWVPLASLADPVLVETTAAQALASKDTLPATIGDKRLLLVLDNFEHLLEAAAGVAETIGSCPNLTVLVTSREPLHVDGEWEVAVDPLQERDALELFVQRALAVSSDFSANGEVAEICERLDYLPLAIELAAARVKALAPPVLLERLEQRLPLLTGGSRSAPERQRTLRATIAWSHDLLTLAEQDLFARFAVFAGGCRLEAAEEVCGADVDAIASLVDKSLLRRTGDRYWMLETIREFAAERLEQFEDAEALRGRHTEYFLRLAEEAEPHLTGPQQAQWLERLEAEHDNLRLSLDSLRYAGRGAEELVLVGALMRFWYVRGHLREGRNRCEEALAAHDEQSRPRLKALFGAGLLAHRLGDYQSAYALMQERLALARRLEDAEGVASSLVGIGLNAHGLGGYEQATAAFTEGAELARAGGYIWVLAVAIGNLADLAQEQGDYAQARALCEESLGLFRELGDERKIVESLVGLGVVASREGRRDEAEALLRESLEYAKTLVDKELAIWCLGELAELALSGGEAERAARLVGAIETLREETGHAPQPDERRVAERTRSALASELGVEPFAAALGVGREMTFEQTVAFALKT
jgi:predicted ATPase/class 3 adenylate cyclase